ncbi:MAG: hypothetical protein J6R01_03880 [Alistipes sp.]|nr:hypothetical protein [Alistipes sp.]MBO7307963.1 hypothetical protein [Alistipes sp.]
MGYHRRFSRTIYVRYSGSISYPASQSGGSMSYSGTAAENVDVDVYVDTAPFDVSVDDCKRTITGLNTSVTAMSAAQVAAINANAEKIGSTIIKGFFSTVSSEISQQMAELRVGIDATLLRLNELAKRCADKQRQMQNDYTRITSRYMKIFEELDKECENRIFEIDRPAFIFKRMADTTAERATGNDLATTAAVAGGESSSAEARIAASYTKRRAMEALDRANDFLVQQHKSENIINQSLVDDNTSAQYYVPACYVETKDDKSFDRQAYVTEHLQLDKESLVGQMRNIDFVKSEDDAKQLCNRFNQMVSSHYADADDHERRVRDYVTQLFNNDINNE